MSRWRALEALCILRSELEEFGRTASVPAVGGPRNEATQNTNTQRGSSTGARIAEDFESGNRESKDDVTDSVRRPALTRRYETGAGIAEIG